MYTTYLSTIIDYRPMEKEGIGSAQLISYSRECYCHVILHLVVSTCQSTSTAQPYWLSSGLMWFHSSLLLKHVKYLASTRNCEENSTFSQHDTSTFTLHSLQCYLRSKHYCDAVMQQSLYVCSICIGYVHPVAETLLEKLQNQWRLILHCTLV